MLLISSCFGSSTTLIGTPLITWHWTCNINIKIKEVKCSNPKKIIKKSNKGI